MWTKGILFLVKKMNWLKTFGYKWDENKNDISKIVIHVWKTMQPREILRALSKKFSIF